jgi:RHS repeat-associated protein
MAMPGAENINLAAADLNRDGVVDEADLTLLRRFTVGFPVVPGQTGTEDTNPFRYAGEYFDEEVGTYYLRNRVYNPAIGRFTQEDPIRSGTNWYDYCGGNPIAFVDPMGLTRTTRWVDRHNDFGGSSRSAAAAQTRPQWTQPAWERKEWKAPMKNVTTSVMETSVATVSNPAPANVVAPTPKPTLANPTDAVYPAAENRPMVARTPTASVARTVGNAVTNATGSLSFSYDNSDKGRFVEGYGGTYGKGLYANVSGLEIKNGINLLNGELTLGGFGGDYKYGRFEMRVYSVDASIGLTSNYQSGSIGASAFSIGGAIKIPISEDTAFVLGGDLGIGAIGRHLEFKNGGFRKGGGFPIDRSAYGAIERRK